MALPPKPEFQVSKVGQATKDELACADNKMQDKHFYLRPPPSQWLRFPFSLSTKRIDCTAFNTMLGKNPMTQHPNLKHRDLNKRGGILRTNGTPSLMTNRYTIFPKTPP